MSMTPWFKSEGASPRRAEVGTTAGREQLTRLFKLVLLLQTERFPNARELSERCEVSRRTVYRDLELLAAAGLPVHYRQEREGYQLARGFFLAPTGVDAIEALALLVLARQWAGGDSLGLLRHAWGGAVKVVQSLPAEVRERVLAAVEPFEPPTSGAIDVVEGRPEIHETILAALSQFRQIRICYKDAGTLLENSTKLSIYRLLLHDGHWFMVGRSSVHRRVEVIGVPWVQKAVLTDDRSVIPPRFRLDRYLAQSWGVGRGEARYHVWLRFSARVAPELNDTIWHSSQKRIDLADGRVDLQFSVDGLDEIVRWVLRFSDQVEVLGPSELRLTLFRASASIARLHRPSRRASRSRSAVAAAPVASRTGLGGVGG